MDFWANVSVVTRLAYLITAGHIHMYEEEFEWGLVSTP